MRELTFNEMSAVAGAEDHNIMVIDPVAAAQTFLFLMSVTDREGFLYGSVITGMTAGAIGGGMWGYGAAISSGALAAGGAAVGCAALGAIVGGFALKGAATFAIGSYNLIMG